MRKFIIVFSCIIAIFLASAVSAEIILSQPKSIYSAGDLIEISAKIKATSDSDSVFKLSLICDGLTSEISSESLYLSAGGEYNVEKNRPLTNYFLNGLEGNCKIIASYNNEVVLTPLFKISKKIDIDYTIDKNTADPGESVNIKGNAVKANSQLVEGFIEVSASETSLTSESTVSQGKFDINFSFPDNIKSKAYSLKIKVFEKSKNEIINEGEAESTVNINQKPTELSLVMSGQNVVPGSSLRIRPEVYDQAGDFIESSVKVELKQENLLYFSREIKSGQDLDINFAENASPGFWQIQVSALGLSNIREISVEELEKADFDITGDTLIVKNIGNVNYEKEVQVVIDDTLQTVSVSLEPGKSKSFRLTAPDGQHSVRVSDGKEDFAAGEIGLTGSAIGVKGIRSQIGIFNKFPVVWIFLILVFGMFIFVMSRRVIKKRFYGYVPSSREMPLKNISKKEGYVNVTRSVSEAEHSPVLQGNKEEASVISLKIRNLAELQKSKEAFKVIDNASEIIGKGKGSVHRTGESIVGVFAPSVTKTYKNDISAVKVASAIASEINEYNQKSKDKIDFGIGVHSGEIIARVEGGKLRFTPLGNAVNLAKKISDSAQKKVLVSSQVNKKINPEVRTIKQGEYYNIDRIIEREQHKQFINNFLERQKK